MASNTRSWSFPTRFTVSCCTSPGLQPMLLRQISSVVICSPHTLQNSKAACRSNRFSILDDLLRFRWFDQTWQLAVVGRLLIGVGVSKHVAIVPTNARYLESK